MVTRPWRMLVPLVLATMASQSLLVVLAPTIVAVGADLHSPVATVGQPRGRRRPHVRVASARACGSRSGWCRPAGGSRARSPRSPPGPARSPSRARSSSSASASHSRRWAGSSLQARRPTSWPPAGRGHSLGGSHCGCWSLGLRWSWPLLFACCSGRCVHRSRRWWPSARWRCWPACAPPPPRGSPCSSCPSTPPPWPPPRTAATQAGYLVGAVVGGLVIAGPGWSALGIVLAVVMASSAWLVQRVREVPAAP